MAVFTSTRRATDDEIVAEMDRRGVVIERLEGRIKVLEDALLEIRDDLKTSWQTRTAEQIASAALVKAEARS